jgi:hypothetical protein
MEMSPRPLHVPAAPLCVPPRVSPRRVSGVLDESCGADLNHAILVTGYSYNPASPNASWWHIKNSWSALYGEQGFLRAAMGVNGTTGIGGITLGALVPPLNSTSMPRGYDPANILLCPRDAAGSRAKQVCWERGDTCCCTKKGFLGCKEYECCSEGQTCDEGTGCRSA